MTLDEDDELNQRRSPRTGAVPQTRENFLYEHSDAKPRATADEIHAREVLARRRAMINQGAASIRVTVERDGKPV